MTSTISLPLRYASRLLHCSRAKRWPIPATARQSASDLGRSQHNTDYFVPLQQHGSVRLMSSSSEETRELKLVYVHPLSQIVLECLQSDYSEWLVRRGLHHNSLTFHRDGTFEIKFPQPPPAQQQPSDDSSTTAATNTASTPAQPSNNGDSDESKSRIWTSFDEHDKKHWLTVQRGKLVGRYMLQDNLMSAWQGNRKGSLPSRIQQAVNEMVEAIEKFEGAPKP